MELTIVNKRSLEFKQILDTIHELPISETNLNFNENGLNIQTMDSSHVSVVMLDIDKQFFDKSQCISPITIGINLDLLTKLLKSVTKKDHLRLVKNDIDDYLYSIEKLGIYGNYITINISSPNTPGLRDLQLRGRIETLVKKIQDKQNESKQLGNKPIFIKISPDLDDEQLRDIALMSLANNVNGLIISNSTIKRPSSLVSSYKNELGGLSGKPIFVDSTIILKKMYSLTNGQIPLIGVGGISNGYECYEKIKAGASLVQLYTSLIYQGPQIINKIIKELNGLILTDGFKNISEVIGKSS